MAKVLYAMGDDSGSVRENTEAIRLNPRYTRAHYNLGVTYNRMKLFARALEEFDEALRLDSQMAEAQTECRLVALPNGKKI